MVVYVLEFLGARMSATKPTVSPGDTLSFSFTGENCCILVPPEYMNVTVAGYQVAWPTLVTFQMTEKRSPGLKAVRSAIDCETSLQANCSDEPPGMVGEDRMKTKGVYEGSAIGVMEGSGVGVSMTARVTVGEGVGDAVGVDVAEGVDGPALPSPAGIEVGVAGAAQAPRKTARARKTIRFRITLPLSPL